LGGEGLREEAKKRAAEEAREDMEELFRSMAKRGKQANLSFFAFTATPKHKTLAVFGRNGRPAHRYTTRQAIEEEFILDVLKHYTTYATYFKLLKACEDDPRFAPVGTVFEVDVLVLERAPQPLDENVVEETAAPVHRDADAAPFEGPR
jgi:type I site-specific restriction-modification system R (restriction) subunit